MNHPAVGRVSESATDSQVVLVVVPLRIASTRLPKKITANIAGASLAQRTLGRALEIFRGDPNVKVVAAVDHAKIAEELKQHFPHLHVVMTDPEIPSGTDRVFAASQIVSTSLLKQGVHVKGIINLQGDIPFVGYDGLRRMANYFIDADVEDLEAASMLTLSQSWPRDQDYEDPAAVKVISDRDGFAIYFSRHAIPHSKIPSAKVSVEDLVGELHIGVYGYTPGTLALICTHAPIALELAEGLEQLRALWLGHKILVFKTEPADNESYRGIDTAKDLAWAKRFAAGGSRSKKVAKKAAKKARKKVFKKSPAKVKKKVHKR